MIVFLDSSVLVRAYLSDEDGHDEAAALLEDPDIGAVTGTWTRIEVSGALVRAAQVGRCDSETLLSVLDADLGLDGVITLVSAPQGEVEDIALDIVRTHALGAMDAWHLAAASLIVPALSEPGEDRCFATRDEAQAAVAQTLGFKAL